MDDTAKTSTYLRNLIELGIIEREFSVEAGTRERANANRGTYKLTDNFFRFWYAFAFTNYSDLEAGDVDGVYAYAIKPMLHEYAAFTFEDIPFLILWAKSKGQNQIPCDVSTTSLLRFIKANPQEKKAQNTSKKPCF